MLLYATITPPLPKPEDWSSLFKLFIWLHKQTIPHNNPVYMAIHRESWMFVFFSPRKDKLSAHSYDIPSNAFRSRLPLHGIIPPLKMHFSNYKCKDSFARQVERKVVTHTAVACGFFGWEYGEETGGNKQPPDHSATWRKKRGIFKFDLRVFTLNRVSTDASLRKSSSP